MFRSGSAFYVPVQTSAFLQVKGDWHFECVLLWDPLDLFRLAKNGD